MHSNFLLYSFPLNKLNQNLGKGNSLIERLALRQLYFNHILVSADGVTGPQYGHGHGFDNGMNLTGILGGDH